MHDILEKLEDLHKQATTERSHYYVALCCREARDEIIKLRRTLEARTITGEKVAQSIPLSVAGLMFAFVDECRTMSHMDRATAAKTLSRDLNRLADEEVAAHVTGN